MTKKKTAANKSSTETNAEAEAAASEVETKKTTKKTSKKTTAKKTTKKKTTKKTTAKKTTKKKTTKKTAAKKTTKKTSKKTAKKATKKKTDDKPTASKQNDSEKKEVEVTEIINEENNSSKAKKISDKETKTSEVKNEKQNTAKETQKQNQLNEKAVGQSSTSQLEPEDKQEKNHIPLPGEKISSALLALEANHNGKKTQPVNSKTLEKKTKEQNNKDKIPEKTQKQEVTQEDPKEIQSTKKLIDENKKEEKTSSDENTLSKSARKRRNQRKNKKKRQQEENNLTENAETVEQNKSLPVQKTVKESTNKPQKRKDTGRNMLINVVDPGEIRVAIAGKKGLEEIYIEKSGGEFVHGNIFKGIVENVEPNLQAAFVNIGAEKNGFLHVRDVIYPFGGFEEILGKPNRQPSNQKRPPINHMLHKGQEILVQITREQVATKGPSLTTYISLPGRYLVLMPAVKKRGVSKKITDKAERDALKKTLEQLNPPHDMGFIIRTAGMGKGKDELQRDLDYLTMLWDAISNYTQDIKSPVAIYQESDLVIRAIRDYFSDSIDNMIIDSEEEFTRAVEFLNMTMPEDADRASFYKGKEPLFSRYNVEKEISALFSRSVRLKSGGELIIEQTEAMVTIDVNTGRFVKGSSSHDMVLKSTKKQLWKLPSNCAYAIWAVW